MKKLFDFNDNKTFRDYYKDLLTEALQANEIKRRSFWSESIAVGDNNFVVQFKEKLQIS